MANEPQADKSSVVVLLKGGRQPEYDDLTQAEIDEYSQEHIDLMLDVVRDHKMKVIEGYKLIAPQGPWVRFWVVEFPTLEGAEAWIEAELKPPLGLYGHYEYYLARRWGPDLFSTWETRPRRTTPVPEADPSVLPPLGVDRNSLVILLFGRYRLEGALATPEQRGDAEHVALMKSIAQEHGLMRLEAFRLITPQPDWHRAWVVEFPTLILS